MRAADYFISRDRKMNRGLWAGFDDAISEGWAKRCGWNSVTMALGGGGGKGILQVVKSLEGEKNPY